ncbi:hypothetical protein DFH09DRAFT_1126225, partial [Mycena vulgaris]
MSSTLNLIISAHTGCFSLHSFSSWPRRQFRLQPLSALLYYDYALTFPKELQYIWNQKFRLSTALYICCRYAL